MRISDWSSDVCSSDLIRKAALSGPPPHREKGDRGADRRFLYLQPVVPLDHLQGAVPRREPRRILSRPHEQAVRKPGRNLSPADRKSVVEGKSVSVRVDLGGRRIIKKKKKKKQH